MSKESQDRVELLEFPCEFPVKAIGHSHANVRVIVEEIVAIHVEEHCVLNYSERDSGKGKYTAATITIQAHSKDQLDKIYQALTDHESIVFAI